MPASSPSDRVLLRRKAWREVLARPAQRLPEGNWSQCYIMGGRGSGKTRAGAEGLADLIVESEPNEGDWAVIGPTFADARDTCVEGPSGLLRTLAGFVVKWNRSQGQLMLADGSTVFCDGADDGAKRTQGKNLRGAWCDEIGLWRTPKQETSLIGGGDRVLAWDETLLPAVRLAPAKVICTGTPKGRRGPLVRRLIDDPMVPVHTMRTLDNAANLSAEAVDALVAAYAGTHLGRQELEGEYVENVEGALWTQGGIDAHRLRSPSVMSRIVVGVDPAGSVNTETGIVAAGAVMRDCLCGSDEFLPHAQVLADDSLKASPDGWGRRVVETFDSVQGDRVAGERNYGGDMVESTIRTIRPGIPFVFTQATRGKLVRAEPIAALYEQGRVHHVGVFDQLEAEMTTFTADSPWSPNRLDALVWALTELNIAAAVESMVPQPMTLPR